MYLEFIPGQKHGVKNADISDTHEAFQDAGWVLEDSEVVIDIDDIPKELIQKVILHFEIKTQTVWTQRGAHLYFKKPSTFKRGANAISPLGFNFEIKHQGNTKAVTIKQNGKLREIENWGIREDVPEIFRLNRKYEELYGMDDGDGRNSALFRLRAKVGTVPEWRKILYFVNDYIFSEPLPPEELEILTREMRVEAEKDNEYQMASWIMQDLDFLRYGQRYYFKNGNGDYDHNEADLVKKVFKYVGPQKTRYIDEVVKQMRYRARKIPQDTIFKIKFPNGYLEEGQFYELELQDFSPYNLQTEYDPEAEPVKVVDEYINHLTKGDKEYRNLLIEVLGHTLIVNPEFKRMLAKFFIFVGDGGNGKGTLLTIINKILGGSRNVSGMSIGELSDERYLPSFKGKLANLGDDIQDQAIDNKSMKVLKNISTCDFISTRELYRSAEDMYFTGSLIFTSNHVLKSWEKGESYKRRVMWLPMFTKVKKKDPLFITNLTTDKALKYWTRLIVEGYQRLYENGSFTISQVVEDYNAEYHRENNPALDFIEDFTRESFVDKPIAEVFDTYKNWCEDNEVNYSKKMITDVVEQVFDLTRKPIKINGKTTRCFVTED